MRLRTLLGDHPGTAALKNGSIRSDLIAFDFAPYAQTNKGFKPMVREGAFDVSEMAIVTYLMAKSFEKPMVLLPDTVLARFQHGHALYNAKKGKLAPRDLNGKRVGIRSFTTTTGAWLRGILANDYGVDLDSIDWVTFEDAHVAQLILDAYAKEGVDSGRVCATTLDKLLCHCSVDLVVTRNQNLEPSPCRILLADRGQLARFRVCATLHGDPVRCREIHWDVEILLYHDAKVIANEVGVPFERNRYDYGRPSR